jgi:serine/threonine protein kinase
MKHVGDDEINCWVLQMLWNERTEDYIPYEPFSDWPDVSDAAFKDLVRGMMNLDPMKRVTARQASEHPLFAGLAALLLSRSQYLTSIVRTTSAVVWKRILITCALVLVVRVKADYEDQTSFFS